MFREKLRFPNLCTKSHSKDKIQTWTAQSLETCHVLVITSEAGPVTGRDSEAELNGNQMPFHSQAKVRAW